MSRHNRERREHRRRWGCKGECGFTFIPASVLTTEQAAAPAVKAAGLVNDSPVTIVCPACNTFHFLTDDRKGVRLLTDRERFQLYMDVPDAARRAETHVPDLFVNELEINRVEG